MATIEGRVVEYYTGRPIPGVLVTIDGIATVTDYRGIFRVTDLPPRVYRVEIVHRDFERVSLTANLLRVASLNMGDIRVKGILKPL